MNDAAKPLTRGWKITIVLALLIALGNSGISTLREREDDRFQNHEARIDELENVVRGNDTGSAPPAESHHGRIDAVEKRLADLEERLLGAE